MDLSELNIGFWSCEEFVKLIRLYCFIEGGILTLEDKENDPRCEQVNLNTIVGFVFVNFWRHVRFSA